MISISGYKVTECIVRDTAKALFHAKRLSDGAHVLLKIPAANESIFPALQEIENEVDLSRSFDADHVLKIYERLNIDNIVLLALEGFNGISLDQYLQKYNPSLSNRIGIALQLACMVDELHSYAILHRDIRPHNILINPDDLTIKLWDLSVACRFNASNKINLEQKFELALGYISPEQSGRMDTAEDKRSDLYSLGVTLYELFTGKLPFEQTDINELVHAHIAKQPAPPLAINSTLPIIISDIILKLLAKKPEERYQSARSLKFDLKECCNQYCIDENITPFIPGKHELDNSFKLAPNLYGREEVIQSIITVFKNISNKSEFILLSGNSGIGKSSVIHEVRLRLQKKNILILSGRSGKHNQNIPFGIFVDAFNTFINSLRNDTVRFHHWREIIIKAMGSSADILLDIIPELEFIVGKKSIQTELPPAEAQKRMLIAFSSFIEAIASPKTPFVIFLDDIQWADSASINFLQHLITSTHTTNILLIATCRDTEIDNEDLSVLFKSLEKKQSNFRQINLDPLNVNYISQLLVDTLGSNIQKTRPLADYLLMHTLGNPLFIAELIIELYKSGLITFDDRTQGWKWSIDDIVQHASTRSSLELITEKINRLPRTTQQTILYAACIGCQFDLSMLAALMDKPDHETADELKAALRENLIVIAPSTSMANTKTILPKTRYQFFHEQVQQAACSLISLREQHELHLNIGYFLLEKLSEEERESQIFEIVNHLNLGRFLITEIHEKHQLANLNLKAGEKAQHATAFEVAHSYFKTGIDLLTNADWATQLELCYALHLHGAESAYLVNDFETSDNLITKSLSEVNALPEKISIYKVQIQSLIFQHKKKEAVAVGLQVLKSLSITFPSSPSTLNFLTAYAQTKLILLNKKIETLQHQPKMQDAHMLAAMEIMQSITAATYNALPNLYPLLVLKMTSLSVKYGHTKESPLAYATCGAIVNAVETNNVVCFKFGTLAMNLLQNVTDVGVVERTLLVYNLINRLSHQHLHESLDALKQCYRKGIELGDLEYAVYTSNAYSMLLCISGKNLLWAKDEMMRCNNLPAPLKQENKTNDNEALIQFVANLLNESDQPKSLNGKYFSEETGFDKNLKSSEPSKLFVCYQFKMILCYLLEDYDEGLENLALAKLYIDNSRGMVLEPLFYFYAALLNYAQHAQHPDRNNLRIGNSYKKKLKKWANQVPINYQHRYLLVEAELARVTGETNKALLAYDKSIRCAQENNHLPDEALAHELAAKCWNDKGQQHTSFIYLTSAIDCYKKWGCNLKVKHLENFKTLQKSFAQSEAFNGQRTSGSITPSLDMATILKASTALSSEVVFSKLLEKLMKFVIENAGAQAGYFILDWGGKLYIEARQSVTDEKSIKLKIPLAESELIPKAIVEHVFESRQDVVLTDAQLDNIFSNDAVVIKNKVRSALCIPALNQGKLVGALYLENNLTTGAFTKDRVELLKLLSGQIAVSIENSILYENLEQKVAERTAEIQVQKEEIERQKQLVEEKSKFKEQFFANMSHEIRTPMTAIIGMSELIYDTHLTQQQSEYAKGIKYSSENLLAIINDILDFSKIEAGKFSFVHKPFQMRERINRLNYMVKVLAEEKNVKLTMDVDPIIPEQLIGDPLRLHQILLNLVSNAIKFTEKGSVSVNVKQVESNESNVILSFIVRDTGIGIAEEKLIFIFETFSRIEDELDIQHAGTGLGLFIAKKLVEEQGGSMTVTSKLKEGTSFQFTLPFKRCDILPADDDTNEDISLNGTRILLVEDTLFNQVVAEEILKKIINNATVIVAENGKDALEKLEQHTVDIILMDIKMPVVDGYTASRHIRTIEGLESIPILAFTSNANPGEADKCKAAGMNDYITKPIESKKLKEKIARLLTKTEVRG